MNPTSPTIAALRSAVAQASEPVLPIFYKGELYDLQPLTVRGEAGGFFERLNRPDHAKKMNDAENGDYLVPNNTDRKAFPLLLVWLRDGKLPADISMHNQSRLAAEAKFWGMDALKEEVKRIYPLREKARSTREGGTTAVDKFIKLNAVAPQLDDARIAHKMDNALKLDEPLRPQLHKFLASTKFLDARVMRAATQKALQVAGLDRLHAALGSYEQQQIGDLRRAILELDALVKEGRHHSRSVMHNEALEKLIPVSQDLDELRAIKQTSNDAAVLDLVADRITKFSDADEDSIFAALRLSRAYFSFEGQTLFERLKSVDFSDPKRRVAWLEKIEAYTLGLADPSRAAWISHAIGLTYAEYREHVSARTNEYPYGAKSCHRHRRSYQSDSEESSSTFEPRKKEVDAENEKNLKAKKSEDLTEVLDAWKQHASVVTTPKHSAALAKFEADVRAEQARDKRASECSAAASPSFAPVLVAQPSKSRMSFWKRDYR